MEDSSTQAPARKAHLGVILGAAPAGIARGATFLFALFRQFGQSKWRPAWQLGQKVFLLSSSIADLLEDKPEANRTRFPSALAQPPAAVVLCFLHGALLCIKRCVTSPSCARF